DDPFTEAVEPSVPYSLAVLVRNRGSGVARDLRIASSEPRIVENEKGLLIDFDLIATEVAGRSLVPSLTAEFGDLEPGGAAVGRWLFQSSLQGQFIEYRADFEHTGPFSGRPEVASVREVSIHELIRLVRADGPQEDGRPDFLVNDVPDSDFLPDTLYLSDGSTNRVAVLRSAATDGPVTDGDREVGVTVEGVPGWTYLRIPDPARGALPLARVLRPDGTEVPLGWNAWTTDRTFVAGARRPVYEPVFHLLDRLAGGPQRYTLVYLPPVPPDTTAPVSRVEALPAESRAQFAVQWSGEDSGGGIRSYDVLVSIDGGPFLPWQSATPATSGLFAGEAGRSYAFYSVAVDAAGNRETPPAAPDAVTRTRRGNLPPLFPGDVDPVVLPEGALLDLTVRAVDPDAPADNVRHRLAEGAPSGMQIDARTGRIQWLTGEADGPSTVTVEVIAEDDGLPSASARRRVEIQVQESNRPPVVAVLPDRVVAEARLLEVPVVARDEDLPAQPLRFRSRLPLPRGATLEAVTGLLRWRPDPTQGPSTNRISVVVSDGRDEVTRDFQVIVRDTEADFRLGVGEGVVAAGAAGELRLTLESELELSGLEARLVLGADGLEGLTLGDLAPTVGSAVLAPVSAREYSLGLAAALGGSLRQSGPLATLRFTTAPGAPSAFVRVELRELAGRVGIEVVDRVRPASGRVVLVGDRPLLDALPDRTARLFGTPGRRYRVEQAPRLEAAESGWTSWREVVLPALEGTLAEIPAGDVFLRLRPLP
ncbi:MAG: hypothetical protein ACKO3N_14105, partial [Verrucomicrobiota bacterium]